jgi:hypothetical protein
MTPREKISAIFAKARSTTSPHERDNAVTLGTRLAEKAGLSLDLFDVPGRVRPQVHVSNPFRYGFDFGTPEHVNCRCHVVDTVNDEQLRDALDALAELLASRKPILGKCSRCGSSRIAHGFFSVCPVCP